MEPGSPDVVNQLPSTGNPMEPTSGTYGKVAETERLKQSLNIPGAGPGGAKIAPTPPTPGVPQGTQVPRPQGGVPDVLMSPTAMPDTPPSTPLQGGAPPASAAAVTAAQRRLSILQVLASSEEVSEETREWADLVLQKLAARQA